MSEQLKQKAKEKLEAEKQRASQKNFADPVITYLLKRCEEDQGLTEDVMQENKTWDKCFKYIVDQARKVPRSGNSVAVEDHVVYEWAEDYYHKEENQKPEGKASKKTIDKKLDTKEPGSQKECSEKPDKDLPVTNKDDRKQIKKEKPKKKDPDNKSDKAEMEGQMSLFDLL